MFVTPAGKNITKRRESNKKFDAHKRTVVSFRCPSQKSVEAGLESGLAGCEHDIAVLWFRCLLFLIVGLFASDFAVKAGECDGKGLDGTQGVVIVQSENVISYSSKLHHNVVHWKKKRKKVKQI